MMDWRLIMGLCSVFALIVAGYGGLRIGVVTFVLGVVVILAIRGISALDK